MVLNLAAKLRISGIDASDTAIAGLELYRDRLLQATERFNLTAIRDAEGIERRHLVESIALGALLDDAGLLPQDARLLDLGTGAGLPGLPIKLVRPDLDLVLLDAHGKRCQFLRELIDELRLSKAAVAQGRAEELGHDSDLRQSFDLVIARAVAPLPVLLEYALPFLKAGGALAATKGSAAASELKASARALELLGGSVETRRPFNPPDGLAQEVIVVRKTGETPAQYPRRSGIPSKRPL